MKTIILAAVGMLAAFQSQANLSVDFGSIYDSTTGGGPFNVTLTGSAQIGGKGTIYNYNNSTFQTFCVEDDIYVNLNTTYNATIDKNALSGGAPAHGNINGSPVTLGTAFLYNQWLAGKGGISGIYNTEIQRAIWNLQGYTGWQIADDVKSLLTQNLGAASNWGKPSGGAYGVYALNLWSGADYNGDSQTQLIAVPVPEANTLIAGAMVLLPFGFSLARRFRKQSQD